MVTIAKAAEIVLKEVGQPLTLDQIYKKIVERKLYDFGALLPKNVLSQELTRHGKLFKRHPPDGKWGLIEWENIKKIILKQDCLKIDGINANAYTKGNPSREYKKSAIWFSKKTSKEIQTPCLITLNDSPTRKYKGSGEVKELKPEEFEYKYIIIDKKEIKLEGYNKEKLENLCEELCKSDLFSQWDKEDPIKMMLYKENEINDQNLINLPEGKIMLLRICEIEERFGQNEIKPKNKFIDEIDDLYYLKKKEVKIKRYILTDEEYEDIYNRVNNLVKKINLPTKSQEVFEKDKSISKNLILYGPPGTGKTFITKQKAVEIIENG